MSDDPEDFIFPTEFRDLIQRVTQGFQDTSGEHPHIQYREGIGSNIGTSEKVVRNKNNRLPIKTLDSSAYSANIVFPTSSRPDPKYPYNQVTETPGGHVIEYDDTPGFERVNIQHKNGSRLTLHTNGDIEYIAEGNTYSISTNDHNIIARGNCNIIVESDANIRVKGDTNIETSGDMNQVVHGDYNLQVNGNHNVTVTGNLDEKVTGNRFEQTRGNTTHYNLSNYNQTITNDQSINIGGDFSFTGQGTYSTRTFGEVQMSYAGGLITVDGFDVNGNASSGKIVSNEFFGANGHLDNLYLSANANISGTLTVSSTGDFGGQVTAPSVHAPTLEGLAKKAQYADTAGRAPDGPAISKTVSANTPSDPTARTDEPVSALTVVDVQGNSTPLIVNLDRSVVNGGFNTRKLSTSEVTSRCRNATLLKNGTWLVDQIGLGSVLGSITSSSAPNSSRSGSFTTVAGGNRRLTRGTKGIKNFNRNLGSKLNVVIPSFMQIAETPTRSKKLSPNYNLSHFLGSDSESAKLVSQLGLTEIQIAQNMQFMAYGVLEKIRAEYGDIFTISEGFYQLYENEDIDPNSFAIQRAQGLGIGLQFPGDANSIYFDVAQWSINNLIFDKIILSYIDYDPENINEPTLLICAKDTANRKLAETEWNHQNVSSNIEDYSNG
jgi:hypothetical protein